MFNICSTNLYFRFSATRWIEDEVVAERALLLWPNSVKVVKYWEGLCKIKRPKNKYYETITKHYLDELFSNQATVFQRYCWPIEGIS